MNVLSFFREKPLQTVLGIVLIGALIFIWQLFGRIDKLQPTSNLILLTSSQIIITPIVLKKEIYNYECQEACFLCCEPDSCLKACNDFVLANPFLSLTEVDSCFCPDTTQCKSLDELCGSLANEQLLRGLNQNNPPLDPPDEAPRRREDTQMLLEDGAVMAYRIVPKGEEITPQNTVTVEYVYPNSDESSAFEAAIGSEPAITVFDKKQRDLVTFIPTDDDFVKITYKDSSVFNRIDFALFTDQDSRRQ